MTAAHDLPYDRAVRGGLPSKGTTVFSVPTVGNTALRAGVNSPLLEAPGALFPSSTKGIGLQKPTSFLRRPIVIDENNNVVEKRHSVWQGANAKASTVGTGYGQGGFSNLIKGRRGISKRFVGGVGIGIKGLHHFSKNGGLKGKSFPFKFGNKGNLSKQKGNKHSAFGKYGASNKIKNKKGGKGKRNYYSNSFNADSFASKYSGATDKEMGHHLSLDSTLGGNSFTGHNAYNGNGHSESSSNFNSSAHSNAHSGGHAMTGSMGGHGQSHGHKSFIETQISNKRFIPKPLNGVVAKKWGFPGVISSMSNGVKKHSFVPGVIGYRRNLTPGYGPPGVISHAHNNVPRKQHLVVHKKKKCLHKKKEMKRIRGQQQYGEWSTDPIADNSVSSKGKELVEPAKKKPKKNVSKNY